MAGALSAVSPDFGNGLDRRRLGRRTIRRARAYAQADWRGPSGLLIGRKRAWRENSHRPRLPDKIGRTRAAGGGNPHRSGRPDYLGRTGRADPAKRTGRRGLPGAPTAPRPLLAAARRRGIGRERFLAGSLPSSRTPRHASPKSGRARHCHLSSNWADFERVARLAPPTNRGTP